MPCMDGGPDISLESAALCAILTVLVNEGMINDVLDNINWAQAGITQRQLNEWWHAHKRRDADSPLTW